MELFGIPVTFILSYIFRQDGTYLTSCLSAEHTVLVTTCGINTHAQVYTHAINTQILKSQIPPNKSEKFITSITNIIKQPIDDNRFNFISYEVIETSREQNVLKIAKIIM